jgi:hypothetical protein
MGSLAAALRGKLGRLAGRRPPVRRLDPATLPPGAAAWLRPDNEELLALERRYAAMDKAVTTPGFWTADRLSDEELLYFRADNHFVWQLRGPNRTRRAYRLTARALVAAGLGALLDRLGEDGDFGAFLLDVDGRTVSRDLLDAAGEVDFLRRHAGLGETPLNILDIGAGYGRLAWRIEQATGAETRIFATDAFARSTFVADHYLKHRGARRAEVVPLDEVEALLAGTRIDLALNVHSFSECTMDAVGWWVERLAAHGVPRLMIVPNEAKGAAARCELNDGTSIEPLLARFGHRRRVSEPRYADRRVQPLGLDPVHLHLFERT